MGRPKKFSRKGVLEKALPVFWRRGFADASLHELEQATGVNKSGLYSEFEDEDIRILEDHDEPRIATFLISEFKVRASQNQIT